MNGSELFQVLCQFWLTKISKAKAHKNLVFQDDADEAFRFFNGPHDFMYEAGQTGSPEDLPLPSFRMTSNRVAEVVQLFGPALYHTNPSCQVTPREPVILPPAIYGNPMAFQQATAAADARRSLDQAKSTILESYLRWVPVETQMRTHARKAVEEALIKGRGLLWVELYQPPGTSFKTVGAYYDSVDNFQIDPDADSMENAKWVARHCIKPVWEVEREYGLAPGTLHGNITSAEAQSYAEVTTDGAHRAKTGETNDLIRYWKIYSRMGLGARLQGMGNAYRGAMDLFGDHVFLVVADGHPYPLNVPSTIYGAKGDPKFVEQLIRRISWPTPFWLNNAWPVAILDFHPVPGQPWPMSHIKPGLGELKFLNWSYSFLAGKIRNTTRDFIAVLKQAGEELKTSILEGKDLTLLEIDGQYKTIGEVVQFLQHPSMNGDIFRVIEAVERNFEKRVGLNELMYGSSENQLRSAAEADIKSNNLSVRPDDMAECVEAFMKQVFVMLGGASRYHLRGADVAPLVGSDVALFWDKYLATMNYASASRELEYRIEAGSVRKPNRARDTQNITDAMQVLYPQFVQYGAGTGDFGPANAMITEYCRVRDIPNPQRFFMRPPVQPALPGPGGPPPSQSAA